MSELVSLTHDGEVAIVTIDRPEVRNCIDGPTALELPDHIAGDLEISTPALLGDVSRFVHATTQSSNAVFARSGARTAVLTTRGFGDTLLIMRATGRVAAIVCPMKGFRPVRAQYMMTPIAQMSVRRSTWAAPSVCSGDMYSGVPIREP